MSDYILHWVHDDRDDEDYQIGMFNKENIIFAMRHADVFQTGHFDKSWLTYKGKIIYEGDGFGL